MAAALIAPILHWKIWEQFRNKSGKVYMSRYSHGACYAWEIYNVATPEYAAKTAYERGIRLAKGKVA